MLIILLFVSYLEIFYIDNSENIKTDRCAAYELTQLSRQRVQMEDNPAYQETGHYATINDSF